MNPTSVPEVGAPEPIETEIVKGVGPDAGVTCSQLFTEYAATVKLTGLIEDVSNTFCATATPF